MIIAQRRPSSRLQGTTVISYFGPAPSSATSSMPHHAYYDTHTSTARILAATDELIADIDRFFAERRPSPAERMKLLHEHTALTWGQIARLFGVSRRAVHLWATGQRMATKNLERLVRLEEVVAASSASTPEETRANLFARSDGESPFSLLLAEMAESRPKSEPDSWADRQPST